MDNDWIKDYRKSVEWGWYKDVPTCHLFFHLLRRVNWKKGIFHGREILPGGRITSVKHLSFETGLTIQQVRTALIKLKSTNEITYETTNTFTHIQVQNWDKYQDQSTIESTNEQQTDNKRITTIEEGNNERKKENNTDDVYTQAGHLSITHDEFTKLEKEFGMEKSDELVQSVLNYRKNSKYKSLYLTAQKWGRAEKKKADEPVRKVLVTTDYSKL